MARNYWTAQALMDDMHMGDAREAALISRENGTDASVECGKCGGRAYYRQAALTEQCPDCRSMRLVRINPGTGVPEYVWS